MRLFKRKDKTGTIEQETMTQEIENTENHSANIESDEIDFGYDDNDSDTVDEPEQEANNTVLKKKNKSKDLILYIIIDRKNPGMIEYFRELGINVSKIFTKINEAQDTLLMQVNPAKILIVDTGTGRFSAMGARKEILDLMGICDEDARISVYYTDTVLQSEVEYSDSFEAKSIHWHKYKSTADIAAHLLRNKNKENYVYDSEDRDKIEVTPDNVLDFSGLTMHETEQINMGGAAISFNDILINMVNNNDTENEVPGYDIVKI